ncbi:MAG: UDP-phosphate glucose phosphotransferase, partial [Brevundimonas sp.]|nr:UDP-phosphate glucose phosphotransferase [Brevundimonas sp.]
MTEALRRHSFDAALSKTGVMDASGLQALAAAAVSAPPEAVAKGAARRGPFRPEVWLNARQRHASRLAAHYFRAFDTLAVVAVSLLCAWAAAPGALIHTEVSRVMPFVIGAATVLGLMRSLGRYRFARGQKTARHLASVAAVVLAGAVMALLAGWVLRGAEAQESAYLVWAGLVLITLHALHIGWSDMVGRWRASGALTPNIVLVGATRHAESLIREALKRRDLNVLGIFDDRLARRPRAIEGVPVLGTAADLLTHKMTPYVDRIVLAIDPRAEARV